MYVNIFGQPIQVRLQVSHHVPWHSWLSHIRWWKLWKPSAVPARALKPGSSVRPIWRKMKKNEWKRCTKDKRNMTISYNIQRFQISPMHISQRSQVCDSKWRWYIMIHYNKQLNNRRPQEVCYEILSRNVKWRDSMVPFAIPFCHDGAREDGRFEGRPSPLWKDARTFALHGRSGSAEQQKVKTKPSCENMKIGWAMWKRFIWSTCQFVHVKW